MLLPPVVLPQSSVAAMAGLQTRLLRQYLWLTTVLYAAGVTVSLLPHGDRTTAPVSGGIAAVCLGLLGLLILALTPRTLLGHRVALAAAVLATPAVMAFHVLAAAQFMCLIAAMFLAMYIRAFHREWVARAVVGLLLGLVLIASALAPAPLYPISYAVFAVAIVGAAEAFGAVTRTLIGAACTDPLTGVFNRAGWELSVSAIDSRSRRPAVAVVTLDVDNFKSINDTKGHQAGDEVLVTLARRWAEMAPDATIVARLGGDEFAVCIIGKPDDVVRRFVERTVAELPEVSCGVAIAEDGDTIDAVLTRADADLYERRRAKRIQAGPTLEP